ncbi:MAG: hypothetical protein ACLTXL_09750 [Clostridia bacterium]
MADFLQEIDHDLEVFLAQGIDFKIVVDALDDSIFITDKRHLSLCQPCSSAQYGDFARRSPRTKVSTSQRGAFTGGATRTS